MNKTILIVRNRFRIVNVFERRNQSLYQQFLRDFSADNDEKSTKKIKR